MRGNPVHRIAGRLVKFCPKCREVLPVERFSPDRTKDWGIRYECRKCRHGARRRGVAPLVRRSHGPRIMRDIAAILRSGG